VSSTGNQNPKPAINAFLTWNEGREYELVQVGAGGFFPTRQFFRLGIAAVVAQANTKDSPKPPFACLTRFAVP
jgi:hypothetical protein